MLIGFAVRRAAFALAVGARAALRAAVAAGVVPRLLRSLAVIAVVRGKIPSALYGVQLVYFQPCFTTVCITHAINHILCLESYLQCQVCIFTEDAHLLLHEDCKSSMS